MNSSVSKYPRLLGLQEKLEWADAISQFRLFAFYHRVVYDTSPVCQVLVQAFGFILFFILPLRLAIVAIGWPFSKRTGFYFGNRCLRRCRFFPFLQPFPLVRALTATFGMQ